MSSADDFARLTRLVQKIAPDSRLRRAWPLPGGVSAQATALDVVRADGRLTRWVVRRHGAADLAQNPHIAEDEFKLLGALDAAGLPVSAPVHVEPSGDVFPTPALVIEFVDGRTDFAPADLNAATGQLAAALARIHRLDLTTVDLPALPPRTRRFDAELQTPPAQMAASFDEPRIRALLTAVWPLPRINATALLHGDYWPGNVLWRDGQLVAVIDWEDATLGDPLADLANSRLEVLWAYGSAAMFRYTRQYLALMPHLDVSQLPYWDLCIALRPVARYTEWAEDAAAELRMREGLRLFITQALRKVDP